VSGLSGGDLFRVAWSADGQTLLASGGYMDANVIFSVFAWDHAGNGARRSLSAKCASTDNSTGELVPLSDGRLFVEKSDPCFTLLKPDGEILWAVHPPGSDFRNEGMTFSVSPDGASLISVSNSWANLDSASTCILSGCPINGPRMIAPGRHARTGSTSTDGLIRTPNWTAIRLP
jgi:hypothetical protein